MREEDFDAGQITWLCEHEEEPAFPENSDDDDLGDREWHQCEYCPLSHECSNQAWNKVKGKWSYVSKDKVKFNVYQHMCN